LRSSRDFGRAGATHELTANRGSYPLPVIFSAALNLTAPAVTHHWAVSGPEEQMKIALLALLGLALGGAALGIGAGLAWVEIFKTPSFEGYNAMLVFFTFMPLGAAIGALAGALLFGVIATRDAEVALERGLIRRREG
jgi:hypothetical protein